MVDGDNFLIKMVKQRPALWNKNMNENKDIELKLILWREISQIINVESDWIRRRWCNLRERYVKDLRLQSNGCTTTKFKYFKELSFLKDFIRFRDKSNLNNKDLIMEEDNLNNSNDLMVLGHSNYVDDKALNLETKLKTNESLNDNVIKFKSDEDKPNGNDVDVDSDQIFIELSDEELESSENKEHYSKNINITDKFTLNNISLKRKDNEPQSEINQSIKQTKLDKNVSNCINCSLRNQDMCEDKIFGELVTALLMKIDNEENKRRVKREIMLMLL